MNTVAPGEYFYASPLGGLHLKRFRTGQ